MTRLDPTNKDHDDNDLHDLNQKIWNMETIFLVIMTLIMSLILVVR
jgi:hypothetical protein